MPGTNTIIIMTVTIDRQHDLDCVVTPLDGMGSDNLVMLRNTLFYKKCPTMIGDPIEPRGSEEVFD